MNILFKRLSQKLLYILMFILCAQGRASELEANGSVYHTIEDFENEQNIDALLLLIQKRLVIMHEVARTKWNQSLPIEDKVREQQILEALVAKANQYGLDEKLMTRFFQAQIEASKLIQRNDFLFWGKDGLSKFDKTFSLKDELRFYIDHINNEMIFLLSKIYKKSSVLNCFILHHPISKRSSDYIEDEIWLLATSPLRVNQ